MDRYVNIFLLSIWELVRSKLLLSVLLFHVDIILYPNSNFLTLMEFRERQKEYFFLLYKFTYIQLDVTSLLKVWLEVKVALSRFSWCQIKFQ